MNLCWCKNRKVGILNRNRNQQYNSIGLIAERKILSKRNWNFLETWSLSMRCYISLHSTFKRQVDLLGSRGGGPQRVANVQLSFLLLIVYGSFRLQQRPAPGLS